VRGLDGACLFFSEEFVTGSFSDARFLEQFGYFRDGRPSAALVLAPAERKAFLERFAAMQREIARLPGDAPHALRAILYEVLVQLNRSYAARYGAASAGVPSGLLARFGALVERDFARRHRLQDYAAELGVSPGHLSAQSRLRLGESAGVRIRARLTLEAKRLLLFGGDTVAEIADRLGFDDPAYFARFFRREAGCPPARYRADRQGRVSPPAAGPGRSGSLSARAGARSTASRRAAARTRRRPLGRA
jgi:AraC-like DNA-binding protein